MNGKRAIPLLMGLLLCAVGLPVRAEEKGSPSPESIRVDLKARRIEIDARMANPNRELEYILVLEGEGPDYESLMTTDCRAEQLRLGLIMLGLAAPEPNGYSFGRGALEEVHGEKVEIWVQWPSGQKEERRRLEDIIQVERHGGSAGLPRVGWAFLPEISANAGFAPGRGEMHAGITGNLISLIHDPFSVLTNPASQEADWNMKASSGPDAPKRGTKVKVIIEPASETRLARNAVEDAKEPADKEASGRLLKWAQLLDKHRDEWKGFDHEEGVLSAKYDELKRDKNQWQQAQAITAKLGKTRQEKHAALINLRRAEAEISAIHLAGLLAEEQGRKEPQESMVEYLKTRCDEAAKGLNLLRLLVVRENANRDLARMEDQLKELERAGKKAEAEALTRKRDELLNKAEEYDIRINVMEDAEKLEEARQTLMQAQSDIQFYTERIENSNKELATRGIDPKASVKAED